MRENLLEGTMSPLHTGVTGDGGAPARQDIRFDSATARDLAPNVLGLALARTGLIAASYGSYNRTDLGVYTDGATLAALVAMGALLLALAVGKRRLRRRAVTALALLCVLAETLLLLILTALAGAGDSDPGALFCLSALLTLFSSGAMFYWLRRARGCSGAIAAAYVFGALIVSEVFLEALSLMSHGASLAVAAAGSALPLACMALAFRGRPLRDLDAQPGVTTYFGHARTLVDDKRFLVSTAIGIGLLSIVVGLLRGYSNGQSVTFTEPTRLGYALATIAASTIIILLMLRGNRRAMSTGIWVTLELLACLALIAYTALPQALEYGALFTTTTNALMVGLVWYTVIAFESLGWRDPYYYALAGWIVWLGCRGIARMGLLAAYPLATNDLAVNTVMGAMLLVSTQVVFCRFLRDAEAQAQPGAGEAAAAQPAAITGGDAAACREGSRDAAGMVGEGAAGADHLAVGPTAAEIRESVLAAMEEDAGAPSPFAAAGDGAAREPGRPPASRRSATQLSRLMGLDEADAPAAVRQPTLASGVEEIGRRFMLSEREVEVLTLYALGYTQKRVAEELFISPGTAHTHIKRIYAKTGMHSRQDVLDYLEEYGA